MGTKILRHQDLIVYKKAMDLAMRIFDLSKSFPKEEPILSPIRYVDHHDQLQQTSQRLGENVATQRLLSAN